MLADADEAGTRRPWPCTGARTRPRPARSKPWFAIGGIDEQRLPEVLDAGAHRVVVVRAITAADDPQAAAGRLKAILTDRD